MSLRQSAPLLLLAVCIGASVAVADLVSSRAWLAGGHATPAQWALHELYESLGVHDHHGRASDEASHGAGALVAIDGSGPVWSVAGPTSALDSGQIVQDQRETRHGLASQQTSAGQVQAATSRLLAGPDATVLDPPPRHAA